MVSKSQGHIKFIFSSIIYFKFRLKCNVIKLMMETNIMRYIVIYIIGLKPLLHLEFIIKNTYLLWSIKKKVDIKTKSYMVKNFNNHIMHLIPLENLLC